MLSLGWRYVFTFSSRKHYTLQALRVLLSLFLFWHSSWELHMTMIHWPYRTNRRIGQVWRRLAHNLSCEFWEQSVSKPQMPQRPLCSMNIKWNGPDGSVFKALATKPSNLCSVTGTHMEKDRTNAPKFSSDFYIHAVTQTSHRHTCRPTQVDTHTQQINECI